MNDYVPFYKTVDVVNDSESAWPFHCNQAGKSITNVSVFFFSSDNAIF